MRKTPPSSRGSLFTNFEDVQLTDEERVYLNAAALGDVPIIRQSLEENELVLNVNCVDYMGRNALHLAIDNESIESIELLLDKLNFECIEESLLHVISKGGIKIVKLVIEHPNYIAGEEKVKRKGVSDPFFRTEEKSQFSPDITPLILAAHYNNHEVIQIFLSRNQTIDRPHPISCQCNDCVIKQNYDSLKRSRSRLNAYRALASPAYMALSSPDPIMTTFELRQEMKKLAQVEKEFKNEYLALVEQCMDFACELMDLCRGTQEVEAVLGEGTDENGTRDSLARLKMAMEYEEKKFVAHPNCQQHLTTIWFGPEMGFMQSLSIGKKLFMWLGCVPLVPILCLIYVISPNSKLGNALRCPATKFITHTLSHVCFLILLAAATFRLDQSNYQIVTGEDFMSTKFEDLSHEDKVDSMLRGHFRPSNILMTNVQMCLLFWVFDLSWFDNVKINLPAVQRRTSTLGTRRTVKKQWQAAWLLRVVTCIDLTTLAGDDTCSNVQRLCHKAAQPIRHDLLEHMNMHEMGIRTAAVCVYPNRVEDCVRSLVQLKAEIPVASVATGFPAGQTPLKARLLEIEDAVSNGASEIDVVINRAYVLAADWQGVYDEVHAMRKICGDDVHMKTILAVGELGSLTNVYKASMVCMMAGADFIKTSTGKESVNATLPVGLVMVRAIRHYHQRTGIKVGFKAAGGIRSAKEALVWLFLMKEELGDDWLNCTLFRIGASSLLTDIERQLFHYVTGRYAAAHELPMA